MEYMVPPELAPGIYRHGVGFFRVGEVLSLPDPASKEGEKPHVALIPMDREAHSELLAAQKALPDKVLEGGKTQPHPFKRVKIKGVPGAEAAAAKAVKAEKPVEAKKADK